VARTQEGQIVLAAEVTNSAVDFSQLDPMITAAICELQHADAAGRPGVAVADAQYWNEQHMHEVIANKHVQVLIAPDSGVQPSPVRDGRRALLVDANSAGLAGRQAALSKTQTDGGARVRPHQTQPHGHQIPTPRTDAVRTEWRLLMATHNLTKLHRDHLAAARA
jgi:hypothetical protein